MKLFDENSPLVRLRNETQEYINTLDKRKPDSKAMGVFVAFGARTDHYEKAQITKRLRNLLDKVMDGSEPLDTLPKKLDALTEENDAATGHFARDNKLKNFIDRAKELTQTQPNRGKGLGQG